MKITDWSIVFMLIVTPVLWALNLHTQDLREAHSLQLRYTSALHTAVQDAAASLNLNELQQFESGYGSSKFMRTDKEAAVSALMTTLAVNFGIEDDPLAKGMLMTYIPAVVVIEYDGYSVYAVEDEADNKSLTQERTHRFRAKKPYVYMDQLGNSIAFTLDDEVTAYDIRNGQWIRGRQRELQNSASIPLLQNPELFDAVRRATIVRALEESLAEYMNRHNEYAARIGVDYVFTLPVIAQEQWNNSINDVGIIAFLQGIPVGDRYYNNFAFGGGRLMQKRSWIGGTDEATGIKYFFKDTCPLTYNRERIFTNRRDAAANGYYEAACP
ncbi:hypothetical protein [Paenibacillus fonticola]|uniref:hypothetical protein n=1 Tax=Paenibacillus fonticola TaxID=379896 RepID=UPI00036C0078|nr:hypothetical protein [Paenibacillus fonticola]